MSEVHPIIEVRHAGVIATDEGLEVVRILAEPGQIVRITETGAEAVDGSSLGGGASVYTNTADSSLVTGPATAQVFSISHTLEAGLLDAVGAMLRVRIYGVATGGFSVAANTLIQRIGGAAVFTHSSFNNVSGVPRYFSIETVGVVRTAGASGSMAIQQTEGVFNNTKPITAQDSVTASPIDFTGALDLEYAISIASAGNSAQLRLFTAEVLAPAA